MSHWTTLSDTDFAAYFRQATGNGPYDYQAALGEADTPPAVVHVPTGCGKTQAILTAWLHGQRRGTAPRRLLYALPMRTLVEQTAAVATELRSRLGLTSAELAIHKLMGGERPAEEDWRLRPEAPQILIGTIDMLLSRALNRGYAENRFAWPVAFGLLHADCRWVFDEVQLMGPARATSAQLEGLRRAMGTALSCETTWMSATVDHEALQTVDHPELGPELSLSDDDRAGPLAGRLQARKTLERVDLVGTGSSALGPSIAALAVERHVPGTRTLVVVNTVERAQAAFNELRRHIGRGSAGRAVLLHSRFRPPDRAARMAEALGEPSGDGTIVIATQVVEAGVDTSARTLITDPAPFSSIVQRLGRCNRAGEYEEASVLWLDQGPVGEDASGRKLAAPYRPGDVERVRTTLLELEGSSLSTERLADIRVPEASDDWATLRRRDLLDLFDTSPDLSGTDIDVAPFIREDDDRSVTVFFRKLGEEPAGRIPDEPLPKRDELVQVPRADLRERSAWIVDHVDGVWSRTPGRSLPAGAAVMVNGGDGGYDAATGWNPGLRAAVIPVPTRGGETPQGFASDPLSAGAAPQKLLAHLQEVSAEVAALADALGIDEWREPLLAAAALHDVGKAHPVFQRTVRAVMDAAAHPELDGEMLAKSGARGGHHARPHFRHELASALAVRALDGVITLPESELTCYLVAAHHGKVRMSIRPAPDEERPREAARDARFALGIADGDRLPPVETPVGRVPERELDLAAMELGADDSWTDAAVRLRDRAELGPFRLGFLEALLRVADWRASA